MNDKQKQWTENKVLAIKNEYEPQMPLSDELWEKIIAETNHVHELSKNNVEVRQELIKMMRYLGEEDKKKRSSENGTREATTSG